MKGQSRRFREWSCLFGIRLALIMRARASLSIVWAVATFDLEDRNTSYGTGIRVAATAATAAATRLLLTAYIGLGIAPLSEAADSSALHETMNVNSVRIEVIWIETQAEMDRKRREYGTRIVTDSVIRTALHGFSVLGT